MRHRISKLVRSPTAWARTAFSRAAIPQFLLTSVVERSEVHAKAAQWFAAQGDLESALDHYLAANDYERLADVLESSGNWVSRLTTGDLAWPRRVFSQLPGRFIEKRPRLYLAQTVLGVKSGIAVDLRAISIRLTGKTKR